MSADETVEGKCHFYLIKKKRHCRFQPKPGQQYCPEHACIMGIHSERVRIPCPLNPTHNCYADDLEKHVKKCNVTKVKKATQEAIYYIQGINKGPVRTHSTEISQESKKVCVKDLTSAELAAMITRVNKLYEDHVEKVESLVLEHACVRDEYCGYEEDLSKALGNQTALKKEMLQQASLVGQLDELGFLSGGHCFVEMGAGKGKLSHWIQKASKDCVNNSYLLVERSSVRYKMDSFHKQGGAESDFKRIKIDIEDLCLGRVDIVDANTSVVMVGKHLCGGATDMGIRCAMETLGIHKTLQNLSSAPQMNKSENKTKINTASNNLPEVNKSHAASDNLPEVNKSHAAPDNVPEVNKSLAASDNMPEVGRPYILTDCMPEVVKISLTTSDTVVDVSKSSATNENISVENLNPHHPSSDTQSCIHSPRGTIQHENLTQDDARPSSQYSDITTSSKHDYIQQEKLNVNEKRIANINKDGQDDTNEAKRKECDSNCLEDGQAPPVKTMKLTDSQHRHKLPKGIMIALCCHHNCTWDTYLGQEFMHACGVTPQEFDLLIRLSSWATCAKVTAKSTRNQRLNEKSNQKSTEQEDKKAGLEDKIEIVDIDNKTDGHGTLDLINLEASKTLREQLSVMEREDIGFKCKRLIDTGRLHYLRSKGMKCLLRRYISEDFTPENIVLIGYLPKS